MEILERTAEVATFKSFANCYLREIDTGKRIRFAGHRETKHYIEWQLASQQVTLRAELLYASLCGPQDFGALSWCQMAGPVNLPRQWQAIDPLLAIHMLLGEAYARQPRVGSAAKSLELLSAILDSCQNMARFAKVAKAQNATPCLFLDAEQALIFGHWQHPTPKSQYGFTRKAQETYAPEFHGAFQLDYFAADRTLIDQQSSLDKMACELVQEACNVEFVLADHECMIPVHPLQASVLLEQQAVKELMLAGKLRHLGRGGRMFSATSSMRTLYSEDSDWMLKFSLPIRLTNSVRLNLKEELEAGVAMSRLLAETQMLETCGPLKIIDDPAYLTIKDPERRESGFEVIIRRNPFSRHDEQRIVQVAALTADALPDGQSLLAQEVSRIAKAEEASQKDVALRWFAAYLNCALKPLVRLYDRYGIAYEAHQQNCLLDVSKNYPSCAYLRDNQGYYLSKRYAGELGKLASTDIGSLYYPEELTRKRLSYYLVVNQIFSVISRFGRDGFCEEAELMAHLHDVLVQLEVELNAAGKDFAHHLLHSPSLTSKLNLTTRLAAVDELESRESIPFYHEVDNPLYVLTQRMSLSSRRPHAVAS